MDVIIVGGGTIGYVAAQTIVDHHNVLVLENDPDRAQLIGNRLNVSVMQLDATNPKNLEGAINSINADMVISTIGNDYANLYICMLAKRFSRSITTIACVSNPDYIVKTEKEGVPGIDIVLSPQTVNAETIYRMCMLENAISYESLGIAELSTAVFKIDQNSKIIGKTPLDLENIGCSIPGVIRNGKAIFNVDTFDLREGDDVVVVGNDSSLSNFNTYMGVEYRCREVTILGGSFVGRSLARLLVNDQYPAYVKMVEIDEDRALELSRTLDQVVVINADFTDSDVQFTEGLFKSDCLVVVTGKADLNLLMSMTAHRQKTRKIITRYIKDEFKDAFSINGLDCCISYKNTVSNEISKCFTTTGNYVIRLDTNNYFITYLVDKKSKFLDRYIGDFKEFDNAYISHIIRDGKAIRPRLSTKFQDGDRILVFTNIRKLSEIEKMFGKNASLGLNS